MAVVDLGAASTEQLQAVRQHPAMKGAFAVHVCRKAALTASLGSMAEAAASAQVDKAVAQMQEQVAAGLIQVFGQASLAQSFPSTRCCHTQALPGWICILQCAKYQGDLHAGMQAC
eukprot:GHUV01035922.1.p1 GENE.GHUV01035922.1~~GHUV01035922.1.p1  ORF type:complete len:126 (-),score=26.42 GHUV01035922.1:841-1188(-)